MLSNFHQMQVWIIAPVFMILVSSFLVVVPIALVPEDRITLGVAVVFILLGLPIFFFFAWDKFRLKIFNIISGLSAHSSLFFFYIFSLLYFRKGNTSHNHSIEHIFNTTQFRKQK